MSKKVRAQLKKDEKVEHLKALSMKTISNPTGSFKPKLTTESKLKNALNRVKKLQNQSSKKATGNDHPLIKNNKLFPTKLTPQYIRKQLAIKKIANN